MKKIYILIVVVLLLSGCIETESESVSGTYRFKNSTDDEYFILDNDMTFYLSSANGLTLSGRYTVSEKGELRLIFLPFGSFSTFEKIKTGFKHAKTGEIYVKDNK
jgi:uncharacterized protein YceK